MSLLSLKIALGGHLKPNRLVSMANCLKIQNFAFLAFGHFLCTKTLEIKWKLQINPRILFHFLLIFTTNNAYIGTKRK